MVRYSALLALRPLFRAQVAKGSGGYTAWTDKGLAYQLVQVKSGVAIDDLYTPEIKSAAYDTNNPATIYPYDGKHAKVCCMLFHQL